MSRIVKLEDICSKGSSNIAQKDLAGIEGKYKVFGASGYIQNVDFYHQESDYIAIVKDGSGVGRVMLLPKKSSIIGTLQYIIPNPNIDVRFLYYNLTKLNLSKYANGAAIPHIYFRDYRNEKIHLPSLERQREIVVVLDKVCELIEKRKEQLRKLDTLAESVFYDMFGDPVTNPKGWEKKELGKLGLFKNGLNFGKKSTSYPVKILGISDFKDNTVIRQTDSFDEIYTDKPINAEYLLNNNDIVFVRSNGSKELVGRCVIINFETETIVTFSGFCIRFRKTDGSIHSSYLVKVLSNKEFRKQLFNKGRGCNINNINQQMLSGLMIAIPPLDLQRQFVTIIGKIEEQKAKVKEAIKESEDLFQRLMEDMINPQRNEK